MAGHIFNLLHAGLFLSSADFFSKLTFSKNSFRSTIKVSNILGPDQDVLSVLIRVQTVWKGYQQMTKVAASKAAVVSDPLALILSMYRGFNMSDHVLLNLLNEFGKRDKMQGLPSILLLFHSKLNKFNNTGARMLDFIYHMTLKLLLNLIFFA